MLDKCLLLAFLVFQRASLCAGTTPDNTVRPVQYGIRATPPIGNFNSVGALRCDAVSKPSSVELPWPPAINVNATVGLSL